MQRSSAVVHFAAWKTTLLLQGRARGLNLSVVLYVLSTQKYLYYQQFGDVLCKRDTC